MTFSTNNFSPSVASMEPRTGAGTQVGQQARTQENLTFAYSFALLK